jgi:predicted metal-dependent hydrolase
MNLEYSVIYAARKTLTITVERDRSVVVRAPHGTPREKIDAVVERKKLWLYEKTRHVQKHDRPLKPREFISGSTVLYLGKNYRLEIISEDFDGVLFDQKFLISKASAARAPELLREWYMRRAKERLTPRARSYAKHMGVSYNNVLISDLKYRWGSCTPKNNLNFNWRLIKAPMRVIEYVIVHELTHLLVPNHTADFWAVVRNQLPDYLKSKDWLKRAGGLLEESP